MYLNFRKVRVYFEYATNCIYPVFNLRQISQHSLDALNSHAQLTRTHGPIAASFLLSSCQPEGINHFDYNTPARAHAI
jgi:hypothetical protein